MDATAPAMPLPPSPGSSAYVPPAPGTFINPVAPQAAAAAQQRPVGRPNADPDIQEQRAERHQMKQRIKTILPASMTDGKIAIFQLEGSRGRNKRSSRPVMTILFRELEKAQEDNIDTETYVRDKLSERYGDKGRFLWEAQDNLGRRLPDAGEVEINLSDEAEPIEEDDVDDQTDDTPDPRSSTQAVPPPPPPFDVAAYTRQLREVQHEEKRAGEGTMQMVMAMMQQQMQQSEMRRLEEDRRREREESKEREDRKFELERLRVEQERRDKEEQRREDRERERSMQAQQMQMTLFTSIMNKPDAMTPMLMKMVESKGDRDGMKEVFGMMTEASKQSLITQGEGAKHMMASQAEAQKALMSNVMTASQHMMEQMAQAQAEPTDDPMEKIGRLFKMFAPALGAITQGNQQVVQHSLPAVATAQPAGRPQAASFPPSEYIKGGLYTLMKLETGELAASQRFNAFKWCISNLPKDMLEAIKIGSEPRVLQIGQAGMDEKLLGWIMDEQHMAFLRDCLYDIQRMILGTMTQASAQESYEKHVAYMQAKGQVQPAAEEAEEVAEETTEQVVPEQVEESQIAQPVETNGKRRAPLPPADEPEAKKAE